MRGMEFDTARPTNGLRPLIWGGAALLLLAPLVAMQFTQEVQWDITDFLVFGAMLGSAGGAYELAARTSSNASWRAAAGVAVVTAFLLVWSTLAVGFVGEPNDPANLMFAGVLAVAIGGSAIARFRSRGMARAMLATAFAQAMASLIAQLAVLSPPWAATAIFVGLWLVSSWLFGKAAWNDIR